jgi:tetratricopeptide (TPR) repeat protein
MVMSMKRKAWVLGWTAGLAAAFALEAQVPASGPSPAERRIAQARAATEKAPGSAQAYVELAMAMAGRARETSDPGFYARAEEAAAKALELSPGDFGAQKARAWVLLGQHRFAEARELAAALNRRVPDDVMVYGLLTDAHVELGEYAQAEKACQWMLNLRPGNVPALARAAYLRELFGDIEGALELMGMALESTPPGEAEDRAWALTQMAHLRLLTGSTAQAESLLDQALSAFPDYHYSLAQLARTRAAQGRLAEAVELLRRRYRAAPHPENLYDLAVALERAGRGAEARSAFAEFEASARAEMDRADNSNLELAFYYADHAGRPAQALALARRELERRRNVHTLDAYAWALHRSGKPDAAQKALDEALAVGIREARILYHAGTIAARLGQRAKAAGYLRRSLELNPVSEVAALARLALERLG